MPFLKKIKKKYDDKEIEKDDAKVLDLLLFWQDHGFLRTIWHNEYLIDTNVMRSNQPSFKRLKKWKQLGFNDVMNLRETSSSYTKLEKVHCDKLGIRMWNVPLVSARPITFEEISTTVDTFRKIDTPFVMHCKSGADRTALASGLYLAAIKEANISDITAMFSLRFAHMTWGKRNACMQTFLDYAKFSERRSVNFLTWAEQYYCPEETMQNFLRRQQRSQKIN